MAETAPDFVVTKARVEHLPEIGKLAGALVRLHHATDSNRFMLVDGVEKGYERWFRRELENPRATILAALRVAEPSSPSDIVVGYAYGTLEERDWNTLLDEHGAIHDVFVDDSVRRSGIGKILIERLVSELEARGAKRLVLHTMVTNEAAQRLFASVGFRPTMLEMTRS